MPRRSGREKDFNRGEGFRAPRPRRAAPDQDAVEGGGERPPRFTSPPRPSPAMKSRSGGNIPEELTDAARGMRLQKVIADAGVVSRRQAEELIAAGRVMVNGQVVSALPAWVDPFKDRIEVNGHPIPRPRRVPTPAPIPGSHAPKETARPVAVHDHVYVILHKPRRIISSSNDDLGRAGVTDLVQLPESIARRIYPVGRLDADSSGLILMTNDGELTNRLTHPRYGVTKQYLVAVRGKLTGTEIARLKAGVYLAGRDAGDAPRAEAAAAPGRAAKRATMEDVEIVGFDRDPRAGERTKVLITLREGQNREIRRMMARLGLNVRRLQRVALGPLTLKGLAPGEWRMLTPIEVSKLRRAAGLR